MNTTLTKAGIAGVSAVLALSLLASIAWAMPKGLHGARDPDLLLWRMTQRLDLSQEQQEGVGAVLATARELSQADRTRLRELRRGLRDQSNGFDAAAAQRSAEEIGAITTRLAYQKASAQAEIYALLNEEQQQQVQALRHRRQRCVHAPRAML